jgi:hypothetical protein
MSDEKEATKPTFWHQLGVSAIPAVITGGIVLCGLMMQASQFDQKRADEAKASQDKITADAKQFQEKIKSDQDNFLSTLKASQEQTDKQRAKEFRLRFYERQMAFLLDLSDTVSRLAVVEKPIDGKKDFERLEPMLFGQLQIMANDEIRNKTGRLFQEYSDLLKKQPNDKIGLTDRMNNLYPYAVVISHQCRLLLEKTFELDHKLYGDGPPKIDWRH